MSVKYRSDRQLIEQLLETLQDNMEKGKVSINNLAARLAISPCQLNRRVKASTGQTISEYILDIRLDKAKQLLMQFPEITINEIARQCGFADTAHFSHVFRRREGVSPSKYISKYSSRKPL